MRISTFMYCESTSQIPGQSGEMQKLQINAPLLNFTSDFVPTNYSFSIVCGILGFDMSKQNSLRLIFKFISEEKSIIDTNTIYTPVNDDKSQLFLPEEERNIIFNIDFRNVVFSKEGTYETLVYANEEHLGTYPITMIKRGEMDA